MRSLAFAALLLMSLAPAVGAQATSRITGPINKARSAAAAASARTEAQQRDGLQQRDSAQSGRDSAVAGPVATERAAQPNSGIQAPQKPGAKTTANAPAGKAVASAAPAGKAPATAPASGKTAPPGPGPSSGPVVAAPTNRGRGAEPAGKAPAVASKTSGSAAAAAARPPTVTPPATRPSTTVEAAPDTSKRASFGPQSPKPDVSISREVYGYDPAGRRDPFVSLLQTDDLRPFLSDLLLVGVTWDRSGRNSVAQLRDVKTKEQYRARVGHLVGRMRVSSIDKKQVVFTIEEFGFSRQETLILGDTSKVRK